MSIRAIASHSIVAFSAAACAARSAAAVEFSNPQPIIIPSIGAAAPYPSTIVVGGALSPVGRVEVTLYGLSHTYPADIDIALVGPGGEAIMLMSDTGGDDDVFGVNMTFSDGESFLPFDGGFINNFIWSPTNYDSPDFPPPPAPEPPGGLLADFVRKNPNGAWRLYVWDDASFDSGSIIGGWRLSIEPAVEVTYQGRLSNNGQPLSGAADLQITLLSAADGTAVDGPFVVSGVELINGLFSTVLAFENRAFNEYPRLLEIAVRYPAGVGGYVTLSPATKVTMSPYAHSARRLLSAGLDDGAAAPDAGDGDDPWTLIDALADALTEHAAAAADESASLRAALAESEARVAALEALLLALDERVHALERGSGDAATDAGAGGAR